MTVLYVVSDPVLAVSVSRDLHRHGYEAITVVNAESCLSQLGQKIPDLLLLDLDSMGAAVAKILSTIHEQDRYETMPRFVVGPASEAHIANSYGYGADMYFAKPLDTDELLRCVSLVGRKRGR